RRGGTGRRTTAHIGRHSRGLCPASHLSRTCGAFSTTRPAVPPSGMPWTYTSVYSCCWRWRETETSVVAVESRSRHLVVHVNERPSTTSTLDATLAQAGRVRDER